MIIELYWDHAPNTCRNFAELARRGYYNKTKFHRIVKDFIVQGGDPTGTGRGGASIYGKYFNDEITPLLKHTGNNYITEKSIGQLMIFPHKIIYRDQVIFFPSIKYKKRSVGNVLFLAIHYSR